MPLSTPAPRGQAARQQAAVIVNPTKFDDIADLRERACEASRAHGWAEPLWLETTADDPGTGQTQEAIAAGCDVICPLGGDGTVRTVAQALIASDADVPLGLLPGGTGNLLARNLDLPIDSLREAFDVALTGRDRPVDAGLVRLVRPGGEVEEQYFLVMAGLGFDAEVMAAAPEALKAQMGWLAYMVAGLRKIRGRQVKVRMRIDGGDVRRRRTRTVLIGNCGRLQGNMVLMPRAEVDDGWLDLVSLSPEGLIGWLGVAAQVSTRSRAGHPRVEHHRGRSFSVQLSPPTEAQVDGDPVGEVTAAETEVRHHALRVRVPA